MPFFEMWAADLSPGRKIKVLARNSGRLSPDNHGLGVGRSGLRPTQFADWTLPNTTPYFMEAPVT